MGTEEIAQRANFQFELFRLNLVTNGGLMVFALNDPDTWEKALLVSPFISFILFSLWVHQALAIKLGAEAAKRANPPAKIDTIVEPPQAERFAQILRRISFTIAILANFCLVPIAAVILYSIAQFTWLLAVGATLLVLTVLGYAYWFRLQYLK